MGDAPEPGERKLWRALEKCGADAIFGQGTVPVRAWRDMCIANSVYTAYDSREGAENWKEWEEKNSGLAQILHLANQAYKEWLKDNYG